MRDEVSLTSAAKERVTVDDKRAPDSHSFALSLSLDSPLKQPYECEQVVSRRTGHDRQDLSCARDDERDEEGLLFA